LATDASWDGPAAAASIFAWAGFDGDNADPERARRGFLIYDSERPALKGSYKLPFALVRDGELMASPAGLRAAASRLPQTDAMQAVLDRARAVLDAYQSKRDNTAQEMIVEDAIVGEFRGNIPDVPIAAGVNVEELRALDSDPMFVTLPIVHAVGAVSRNGLLYDEALVGSIIEQINTKRPGALFGHIRDAERDSAFPFPDALWVGAERVGDTAWGKAYVRPGAARDYIRHLKAVGGEISTSIYGKGKGETVRPGVRRLTEFRLESLDFAPPERAALGRSAAPIVTAEMAADEPVDLSPEQEQHDMTKDELIAELTANEIPPGVRNEIVAEYETKLGERDTRIAELEAQVAEYAAVQFDAALEATVAELVDWKATGDAAQAKVAQFRRTVRDRILAALGNERTPEKIAEVSAAVWEDIKPLAETVRDALAGPAAMVAARQRQQGAARWADTPENRANAIRTTGISI